MKHSVSEQGARSVPAEKVMTLVSEMLQGYPNPEDPPPPGPWDPYIRRVLDRLSWALGYPVPWRHTLGPHPEPWRHAFGPQPEPWQTLSPRIAFLSSLSQEVVERVALIHEVAEGIGQPGQKQGIIIVGGLISRFVDDWCGTGWRPKWPFPGPPPWWWMAELNSLDLIVLGTRFSQSAKETFDRSLQEQLQKAGTQFNEAGMARM